jgi:D-serine deaminase-like pyridoxal phosphate-dependent protein
MSAEHGQLTVAPDVPLEIGERLEVVPGYADLTVFLHDQLYGFREGRLAEILTVAGSAASR